MTIRTFDAEPIGTVPGATLFQLNEQLAEEGELCFTADYKKMKEDYAELIRIIFNITDNINVYELPDYLYAKLESRGLL
ncbi:hypothetical protein STP03_047 [Salmonella phage STP03]|uniref:Uncharacterized protein n=1 Tax=Salmonella phage STP03 TaxID=1914788 RepID=A0A1U9HZ39_9CAUD|nr:hypothetical protein QA065_gp45 [Salmonella phage STP03]APM00301.1 hypothetical protein STP03_047 [Salmonella phage STP03]